jgi:hypothetical protein
VRVTLPPDAGRELRLIGYFQLINLTRYNALS